jgi:hypothetical protein
MKKSMFVIFSSSLLILTTQLGAILPPLYQTADEIKSLLSGDKLGQVLPSGEPITEIHKVEDGYEIVTPKYVVHAKVNYLPQQHPGPAHFDIVYGKAEKK